MLKAIIGVLNPSQTTSLDPPPLEQPWSPCELFGAIISTQETIEGLLKAELFWFHNFHVKNVDSFDPLLWWVANESRFPNVGLLA
jgi:hypothetical protein